MANITINKPVGSIGQIQGPFSENDVISFSNNYNYKIGIIIGDPDFMTFGNSNDKGFTMKIDNDTLIRFGREGIYELDDEISLSSLKFPQGAPASVIVDYVVLEN